MRLTGLHTLIAALSFVVLPVEFVAAQEDGCDADCQRLRDAQDPLADVRAIMTDNTIAFGTADDQTSYGFQIQPVYSIPTDKGFNFIARGIFPIVGAQEGATLPPLGPDPVGGSGLTWGLGDTILQGFFVPESDGGIKFGIGPQISLRTRTDEAVGGPGWGAGVAAVAFGFAGDLSYGGILGHHWGQDDFSLTTLQPIVFYTVDVFGGSYFGYNNSITYNWSADSADRWQVPLGLTVGKTFLFDSGYSFDVNFGGYGLVEAPRGGGDAQFKFGLSLFFP